MLSLLKKFQVSPQFVDIPGTCEKHNRRCRNLKTDRTQSVNHFYGAQKVKHKYKALKFLGQGETAHGILSDQEDIEDADDMMKTDGLTSMVQHNKSVVQWESLDAEGHLQKNSNCDIFCVGNQQDVNVLHHEQSSLLQGSFDVRTPDGAAIETDQLLKHSDTNKTFTSIKPRVSKQLACLLSKSKEKCAVRNSLTKRQNNKCSMDLECDFDGIPKRRTNVSSRTHAELFPDFQSQTPVQQLSEQVDILVHDTPEEDYGLSYRKRRLKGINR